VLLGEPPLSRYDLSFSFFGIPVRVHPLFWLVAVLLGSRNADVRGLLAWIVALFVGILFHELGHALVMRAYGFRPSITLYAMGGIASRNQAQAYGSRGLRPLDNILISVAGPAAGFLLAAAVVAVVLATGHKLEYELGAPFGIMVSPPRGEVIGSQMLTLFVFELLFISIAWGIVNLLPVYPLDGGQIAREVLLVVNPRDGIRQSLMLSVVTGTLLAVVGLVQLGSIFMAMLFGYLAYTSFATLQVYSGRGGRW